MNRRVLTVIVCFVAVVNIASADTFGTGANQFEIDFVPIAAGTDSDPLERRDSYGNVTSGYGAVDDDYRIGKYEITNAQWNAFTTAAGAPTGNPSNAYNQDGNWPGDQKPKAWVSWYEAAQFCNYLTSGDKSKGAYPFSGNNANPGDFLGIDRCAAKATYGTIYVIPTEDEWYRAAYHKPGGGYSLFANGKDTPPIPGVETNYDDPTGNPWEVDVIPVNGTMEQNGTYDMMGNVFEWNETQVGSFRGALGGSYENTSSSLWAIRRDYGWPYYEGMSGGFRVASVPEPATVLLLIDIDPDTLNRKSHGKWITVYITLPDGFDVGTIDTSSIAITSLIGETCDPEYTQEADLSFTPQVGDRDEDGILDLTVKFDRQVLLPNLCLDDVSITIEGELTTGELFSGSDSIRIIDRGK